LPGFLAAIVPVRPGPRLDSRFEESQRVRNGPSRSAKSAGSVDRSYIQWVQGVACWLRGDHEMARVRAQGSRPAPGVQALGRYCADDPSCSHGTPSRPATNIARLNCWAGRVDVDVDRPGIAALGPDLLGQHTAATRAAAVLQCDGLAPRPEARRRPAPPRTRSRSPSGGPSRERPGSGGCEAPMPADAPSDGRSQSCCRGAQQSRQSPRDWCCRCALWIPVESILTAWGSPAEAQVASWFAGQVSANSS